MIAPDQGGDASRFHDRDTRRQVQHDKEIQARILRSATIGRRAMSVARAG